VSADLATVSLAPFDRTPTRIQTFLALAGAGFRRYATYRQATVAAAFTNSVFGFLKAYLLLATVAGAVAAGATAAGYDAPQIVLYAWLGQAMIGTVGLWGWTDLGDRIRTGDVVADLLRPMHPVVSYLAIDIGRAAHAMLIRFVVPLAMGAIFFDMYVPRRPATYPLFAVSLALGVVICFGGRYLVNAAGFWLLDVRGVNLLWMLGTNTLAGLAFPLHFLPTWLTVAIWVATPMPSILQAPLDVAVERGPLPAQLGLIAGQAAWAVVILGLCWYVQRRAERRLVIQGG
jgi:ABC-2 type transport system permease protein